MESILASIKKMLGIVSEYQAFDPELIIYINGAFMTLHQLAIGPEKPFRITGSSETWDQFVGPELEAVKTYVFMKVKLIFDPPENSSVQQSYQDQIKELEWRMNTIAEIEGASSGTGTDDRKSSCRRYVDEKLEGYMKTDDLAPIKETVIDTMFADGGTKG